MHRSGRSPAQRFRFEQYIPALEAAGWQCELSPVVSAADDAPIYSPGHAAAKARVFAGALLTRLRDVRRVRAFDVVFVSREALMINWGGIEALLAGSGARLVYDFDDALWLQGHATAGGPWSWLRGGAPKLPGILRRADLVLAGNDYLADYARAFASRVEVMPTTVDTATHRPLPRPPNPLPVIGWSGSPSTVPYFDALTPALMRVRDALGGQVRFRLFGDASYRNAALALSGEPWRLETEVADTAALDIGLMPLPEDAWTRGKCGFKALLYMACGVPAVVSPVGVNREIVADGVNGMWADGEDAWVAALTRLARDPGTRARLAAAGRRTVEERYSLAAHRERFVALMASLVQA